MAAARDSQEEHVCSCRAGLYSGTADCRGLFSSYRGSSAGRFPASRHARMRIVTVIARGTQTGPTSGEAWLGTFAVAADNSEQQGILLLGRYRTQFAAGLYDAENGIARDHADDVRAVVFVASHDGHLIHVGG